MKKTLFLITLIVLTFVNNTATAPAQAQYIWTCRATSPVAIGIWSHPNQRFAAQRAIEECQYRTPPHMSCYLDSCY